MLTIQPRLKRKPNREGKKMDLDTFTKLARSFPELTLYQAQMLRNAGPSIEAIKNRANYFQPPLLITDMMAGCLSRLFWPPIE
jgi:hypothetical protein